MKKQSQKKKRLGGESPKAGPAPLRVLPQESVITPWSEAPQRAIFRALAAGKRLRLSQIAAEYDTPSGSVGALLLKHRLSR